MARASKIPSTLIRSKFAEEMVPSIEVPDTPWITLSNARESLCHLFVREFDRAAKEGDGVQVTRVFKIFPLIGCGDVGLDIYGRYVCQGVASTARQMLKGIPGTK
ncbi:COG4 transport protein-domain-containing protein [Nemania serpens]|nr:COG4 transport protein-domain-containing protein [Nemania serpens]